MAKNDDETPDWPTTMRMRMRNGMCIGTDNSVWVYRRVPLGPVDDAVDRSSALRVAGPLMSAFSELEEMARVSVSRRNMARGKYRQVHLLLVNVPKRYVPDDKQPLRDWLSWQFPSTPVDNRVLLMGVRLNSSLNVGESGLSSLREAVVTTLTSNEVPIHEFERDFEMVDDALSRAGLVSPSDDDFRLANAWWNSGLYPDTPVLVHTDHLHVFSAPESLTEAAGLVRDEVPCSEWPTLNRHHTLAMTSLMDFQFNLLKAGDPAANWVSELLSLGAVAISVRGRVEPQKVTRAELRRNRKAFLEDIREATSEGTMQRSEQDEMLQDLSNMEAVYSKAGRATPTLVDVSVVAAMNGSDAQGRYDVSGMGRSVNMSSMVERQHKALTETMLCSPVRANPHLHDWPSQVVAASGMPSLSVVGDRDGALLGFTERDRQPAYLSPIAASIADGLPMMLVAGATGSGKTQTLLWLAYQYANMGCPQVIIDPKQDSDHSDVVLAAGGQVASLDDLVRADGVFDPLRFAASSTAGLEAAASMLLQVNPWGGNKADYEAPLSVALAHGIKEGAQCIGEALNIALNDGLADKELVDPVLGMAESSPLFRACVGVKPESTGLRLQEGITLIKVGDTHLDLPQPGKEPESIGQRVAVALVRMMVYGSAMALTGRRGVLHLDEAWVALTGGAAEVERLGRLARSQEVFPILYTQRVSDAVNAGLSGYISRGLIMAIADPEEARAACELFKLEADGYRMTRITDKATKDGGDTNVMGAPNWNSLRALRVPDPDNPGDFKTLRGAVGIYVDLAGRAVPVTINLPPDFLEMSSTNTADLRRKAERKAAQQRMAATEAEAARASVVSDAERRAANQSQLDLARSNGEVRREAADDYFADGEPDEGSRDDLGRARSAGDAHQDELAGLF